MSKNILENITVIVPVHTLDDVTSLLLVKALNSVEKQQQALKVLVVHPQDEELENKLEEAIATSEIKLESIKFLPHSDDTDFCSQVNLGVSKIDTEYFSILEVDDEYSDIYFKNVKEYHEAYPEVSAFLPITIIVDKDNNAISLTNEAVWAAQFSDKMGYLDVGSLSHNNNFMICGAVISKEAFEEIGGLKKDIKIYFIYEFLLRLVNNDFTTMVISKIGYKHMFGRDNSLFSQYRDPQNGITPEEAKFYLDSAKNEYFFNPKEHTTRVIKYSAADAI